MGFTREELAEIKVNDGIDEALWNLVQLSARTMGVKNLINDEFTNEEIFGVRNHIVDIIKEIKEWRENN